MRMFMLCAAAAAAVLMMPGPAAHAAYKISCNASSTPDFTTDVVFKNFGDPVPAGVDVKWVLTEFVGQKTKNNPKGAVTQQGKHTLKAALPANQMVVVPKLLETAVKAGQQCQAQVLLQRQKAR